MEQAGRLAPENQPHIAPVGTLVMGKAGIPVHWHDRFQDRMHCFFKDLPEYIDLGELCARYLAQAERITAKKVE